MHQGEAFFYQICIYHDPKQHSCQGVLLLHKEQQTKYHRFVIFSLYLAVPVLKHWKNCFLNAVLQVLRATHDIRAIINQDFLCNSYLAYGIFLQQELCIFSIFPQFLFCNFNHLHILVHGFTMVTQSMLRYNVYHAVLAS